MHLCCFLLVEKWTPIVLILDHSLQVPHMHLQIEKLKLFQNQCDKWIKNPTWPSAKHEVEPKCFTLLYSRHLDNNNRASEPILLGQISQDPKPSFWFQ